MFYYRQYDSSWIYLNITGVYICVVHFNKGEFINPNVGNFFQALDSAFNSLCRF